MRKRDGVRRMVLDNVITLSDHKDLSFGKNFGVVMEELRLLARSVFVLNENNKSGFIKKLLAKEQTSLILTQH